MSIFCYTVYMITEIKQFLPRHSVVSSGLDGNEVFICVLNRMFPKKTTRSK